MSNEDTAPAPIAPHISQLRQHLMDTLADLRNRDNPMEPDRARAVAQVAGVLVDSAKVEIDYIRATGADRSEFIAQVTTDAAGAGLPYTNGTIQRLPGVTKHRMRG